MTPSNPKSVEETYPELWHYTNVGGLQGILLSQELWATDISYLNDGEELVGFFDHKLLKILKKGSERGINELVKHPEGKNHVDSLGGNEKAISAHSEQLLEALRLVTLKQQAFVTSFCRPTAYSKDDGLLSQWRGYGADGGYAIVFETTGLMELMKNEQRKYFYSFGHWGDVDYYDEDGDLYEETINWESTIEETAAKTTAVSDMAEFEDRLRDFFEPVLSLATRHKHYGFSEESEVRVVAFTLENELIEEEQKNPSEKRIKKPMRFKTQNGMLIPYIALFENPDSEKEKLPIKKIVVGPHPDKLKRKISVEKLLDELKIKVPVVTSDIPYLGG